MGFVMSYSDEIIQKTTEQIILNRLITAGDKVLLALSGGADSVAMTHILLKLSQQMGFTVCAAHMNHCLRGDESDYDESFVSSICTGMGIDLVTERADINTLAHQRKQGI